MVRILKFVFVPGLQYLLRTICFQIYLVTRTEIVVLYTLVAPKFDGATHVGALNLVIKILKNT